MQEMVSPFRKLRTSPQNGDHSRRSSEAGWKINPIQVQRDDVDYVPQSPVLGNACYDGSQSSPGSPGGSPCESPVRGDRFCQISPGKLKKHICLTREVIHANLKVTEAQILANSPSKHRNDHIDRSIIQRLKEKRIQQRSQNRVDSRQSVE